MILFLIRLIQFVGQVLTLLVIVHVILSFFMAPFHPVRQTVDRVIEPLLTPIRRVLPTMGIFDFSPLVLLLLVQLLVSLLVNLLLAF